MNQDVRIRITGDASGLSRATQDAARQLDGVATATQRLDAAQRAAAAGGGRNLAQGLQQTSYQLQDFIVQVNGGVSATTALAMQLPQLLSGFGALGAGIGVAVALLPNLVSAFSSSEDGAASLKTALSEMDGAVSQVGRTVQSFDMEDLYAQFNDSTAVVRAATIEQLEFQRAFIETQRLVAQKSFAETVSDLGQYTTADRLAGAWGATAAEKLSDELGITLEVATRLQPVLKGLGDGSVDVGLAFNQFGRELLSGNAASVELAKSMQTLTNGEKDAYAASSALSEALARMAKGHVLTKEEAEAQEKATRKQAEAAAKLAAEIDKVNAAWRDSITKDAGKIADEAARTTASMREQYETLGMTTAELAEYRAAKLETAAAAEAHAAAELETAAVLLDLQDQLPEVAASYRELAAARRAAAADLSEQAQITRAASEKQANLDAAKAAQDNARKAAQEWQRTADKIEDALIDALMEGGKSGREYIEGLFRSMVLRPIVQAIVQPVAGSITSAMGFGAPAGQGTLGSITGAINGVSNLSSLYGAVTGGMTASLGSLAASAGSMFGSSALSAFGAGMQGSTLAAGLAGPTTAGASGAMGLGSMAGAALPWVAGAFAVASLLGAFDKKPSDKSSWAYIDPRTGTLSNVGGMTGDKAPGKEQVDATATATQLLGAFANAAGISSELRLMYGGRDGVRFQLDGGERTRQADGYANYGYADWGVYGGDLEASLGKIIDNLVDEGTLPQATIDAWRSIKTDAQGVARDATELVGTLSLLVAGYDTATIERANLLQTEGEALESALGRMLQLEQALSGTALPGEALAQATAALVRQFQAAGQAVPASTAALGKLIDSLDLTTEAGRATYQSLMGLAPAFVEIQAAQKSLYDQLYTDEQRAANLAREVGDAFARLGVAMPATRDELRTLIDAYDNNTEAGAKLRAQLLGLVPAFVSVSDAAEAAAQEMARAAQRAAEESARAAQRALEEAAENALLLQRAAEAAAFAAERNLSDAQSALRAAYAAEMQAAEDRIAIAESALRSAYKSQSSEIEKTIDRFDRFGQTIRDFREELAASTRTDRGDLAAARANWQRTLDMARLGDEPAMGRIVGESRDYLDLARKYATTDTEYLRTQAAVDAGLATTEALSESQIDIAQKSLTALRAQAGKLIDTEEAILSVEDAIQQMEDAILKDNRTALTNQVGSLIDINASVLSVRDAISILAAATSESAAAAVAQKAAEEAAARAAADASRYAAEQAAAQAAARAAAAQAAAEAAAQAIGDSGYRLQTTAAGATLLFPGGGSHSVSGANAAQTLTETYGLISGGLQGTLIRTRAEGGYTPPGMTLVGEEGPELVNFAKPSLIYNADQTRDLMLGTDNKPLVDETRALREEFRYMHGQIRELHEELRLLRRDNNLANAAIEKHTKDAVRLTTKWDAIGLPATQEAIA